MAIVNSGFDIEDLFSDHEVKDSGSVKSMLKARTVVLELLQSVLDRKQSLDQALEKNTAFSGLMQRDKAFCRMLAATVLRRLGQVDDLIEKAQDKDSSLPLMLTNILRLGVTQVMFTNVPDHAALDTSVQLTESAGLHRYKGYVNGLLRTVTRTGREWSSKHDPALLNTPSWLFDLWAADYGVQVATDIARANLAEAPLDITLKDKKDLAYWEGALNAKVVGAESLRCKSGGSIFEKPGFNDGMWWVQDAAAGIPAVLFGDDIRGRRVADICAAPGGKTMQLATQGAKVTALDRSASRLERLKKNLHRVRLEANVEVGVADAASWLPSEPFDMILLDAPCSATGTIRRHPDVIHLKKPSDIERLISVQEAILNNAACMLRQGGILVYCTCSLQKAEGEHQIEKFLASHPEFCRIPITSTEIGGMNEPMTDCGELRILPYHQAAMGGMDGFFISRLKRVE